MSAPTVCGAFTSPSSGTALVKGQTYHVEWGASYDYDGHAVYYDLYLELDGVTLGIIGDGLTSKHYDFAVPDVSTVRYFVRSRDSLGYFCGQDVYSPFYSVITKTVTPPTLISPKNLGSSFNRRPKVLVNVPLDSLGVRTSHISFLVKSGSTILENKFVATGGNSTLIMTPEIDYNLGTISVEIKALSEPVWSSSNTYSFILVSVPNYTGQAGDSNISKVNYDILKTGIDNACLFRNVTKTLMSDVTQDNTWIMASHLAAMRSNITALLSVLGVVPTWTDSTLTSGVTYFRGTHWLEIFNYLKMI